MENKSEDNFLLNSFDDFNKENISIVDQIKKETLNKIGLRKTRKNAFKNSKNFNDSQISNESIETDISLKNSIFKGGKFIVFFSKIIN